MSEINISNNNGQLTIAGGNSAVIANQYTSTTAISVTINDIESFKKQIEILKNELIKLKNYEDLERLDNAVEFVKCGQYKNTGRMFRKMNIKQIKKISTQYELTEITGIIEHI